MFEANGLLSIGGAPGCKRQKAFATRLETMGRKKDGWRGRIY
jgi:hypothetical protein